MDKRVWLQFSHGISNLLNFVRPILSVYHHQASLQRLTFWMSLRIGAWNLRLTSKNMTGLITAYNSANCLLKIINSTTYSGINNISENRKMMVGIYMKDQRTIQARVVVKKQTVRVIFRFCLSDFFFLAGSFVCYGRDIASF